ncbi:MAG: fatty acid--CoA ligase family protein [Sphingobium sp.]
MATFGERLTAIMAIDPSAIAIAQGDRDYRWHDLARAVSAVNAALDAASITQAHRVGVMIHNRASQLAAMLALFTSERCLVVLNPMVARDKLIADIEGLGLAAIVAEFSDLEVPEIKAAIATTGCAAIALTPDLGGAEVWRNAQTDLAAIGDPVHRATAVEMLTSGTTGPPKRVPLSRDAFDAALQGALVYEKGRSADEAPRLRSGVSLQVGPLAHIAGVFAMLNTLLAGRQLVLFDRFTAQAWREAVVRYRPKVASLVPTALRMILDADIPREDLASLTALRSGTAPLPPETVMEFLKRYDLPVLQNYGATEFIGGISGWTLPDFRRFFLEKPRSCGRIHDGVAARIVDADTGTALSMGEEGVLELKTAQIHGGKDWYRTTDRAIIDADSFLTICGRTDAAIIRGGFKVHPDEVVRALEAHPAVREVSVVGLPDARLGAVPCAAIILREGASASEADMLDFARAHLSAYQVPVKFLIVDDLPRTPSMKPVLPEVVRMIAAAMAAQA